MFKTLRQRFILSHLLPLLVIIPIVGIALIYVLETRILLPSLVRELTGQAELVGELAGDRPDIWHDQTQAETFARKMSEHLSARVTVLNSEGRLIASSDPTDLDDLNDTINLPFLADVLAGQMRTQTTYSRRLQTEIADIWLPISGADGQVKGIIWLSLRLLTIEAQFAQSRYFIAGVLVAGLALGSLVGLVLALDLEQPLRRVTQSVRLVANGQRQKPLPEHGPREIRSLTSAVNTLAQRLRRSEEQRRQLLANTVHELGRPLGALRAAVQALRDGAAEDQQLYRELLSSMEGEMGRLRRVLDDLAHLQDQLAGALTLQSQPVPLSEWLPKMLASWREAAQTKGLNWKVVVPTTLPVLTLDPDRLGQVLGNLLSNAIKYTPAGGTVSISAGVENESVWIRVSDTGPGIAPEDQADLFVPFRRIEQSKGQEGGMGLGLSIAQELIVAQAGKLEVESSPGRGSHFSIWLPCPQDHMIRLM